MSEAVEPNLQPAWRAGLLQRDGALRRPPWRGGRLSGWPVHRPTPPPNPPALWLVSLTAPTAASPQPALPSLASTTRRGKARRERRARKARHADGTPERLSGTRAWVPAAREAAPQRPGTGFRL